jgi:6-phosphogluconolactonase (cycloisomerase 2 family)
VITATEPNPSFLAADPARGIPPDCFVRTTPAELALTPDGRLLFASNRGHDSIVR